MSLASQTQATSSGPRSSLKKNKKQSCRCTTWECWRLSPSLRSEGGQWWLLATASLEATGISCHTLAFGFKPAPFEVTFEEQIANATRVSRSQALHRRSSSRSNSHLRHYWSDAGPKFKNQMCDSLGIGCKKKRKNSKL